MEPDAWIVGRISMEPYAGKAGCRPRRAVRASRAPTSWPGQMPLRTRSPAAAIGSHSAATYGRSNLPKPAVVVIAYTAHSDHSSDEPPTFVIVGEQDGFAPPSIMERRVAALRRSGTEVEFRRYPNLGHGFGPGVGTRAEGWIGDATRFWETFMRKEN